VRRAEQEAEVILWDGGNNDPSFIASDLTITVADPLRAGHELTYWAGETNLTMADVVLINKCGTARAEDIETVRQNPLSRNPECRILTADSPVTVVDPQLVRGKRVLVVEDGPTLTHGEMSIGAGTIAAQQDGAAEIIDPRPYAVGSIKAAYDKYPQLGKLVPALGYYGEQLRELEQTINAADCDAVLIGTPIDLRRVISIEKPATRVRYDLREHDTPALVAEVARAIGR
jgi:predicted GTPase